MRVRGGFTTSYPYPIHGAPAAQPAGNDGRLAAAHLGLLARSQRSGERGTRGSKKGAARGQMRQAVSNIGISFPGQDAKRREEKLKFSFCRYLQLFAPNCTKLHQTAQTLTGQGKNENPICNLMQKFAFRCISVHIDEPQSATAGRGCGIPYRSGWACQPPHMQ